MIRVRYVLAPLILTASISSCSFSTAERTEPTPTTALTSADCPGTLIENPELADALHTDAASLPAHVSIGGGALETSAGDTVAIVQLCAPAQSDDDNRDMASFIANSIQRSPLGSTVTAVSAHIRTPESTTTFLTCGDFQSHDFSLPPSHLRTAWVQ